VLLIEVVEHLKSDILDATLREIHRIMRPGGVLLITTPNNEDLSRSMKFCPDCGAIFMSGSMFAPGMLLVWRRN